MVTHVMRTFLHCRKTSTSDPVADVSSFRSPSSLPKSAHWDTLEKALTVFRLPTFSPLYPNATDANGNGRALHRRLDLIFAPIEVYWCAVIGWYVPIRVIRADKGTVLTRCRTGSTMFQRDIRQYTKDKR